jgi:Fe-S oxidoreductase
LANLGTQFPGIRALAKLAAGVPSKRKIPPLAPQTFQAWFRARPRRNAGEPQVVLWPDTFNNYFLPETAQAAVTVLEHAGFEVLVPEEHVCCGRPLYDYGFLDQAKRYLSQLVMRLHRYVEDGISIVVLEPSCAAVLRDELLGMLAEDPRAHAIAEHTFVLSEFLERKAEHYRVPQLERDAIVQAHCHQKAIVRMDTEQALMRKMGLRARWLASGCCGMAGSFGYEADKYAVSIACGERKLLPEVRRASLTTLVLADGSSCKEQIQQTTNRHALHLAEVMALALRHGRNGPRGIMPEKDSIAQRQRAVTRSMFRTAAAMISVAVTLMLTVRARRQRLARK